MGRKTFLTLLFIVCLSLVVENVNAGWKFWKKKDKDATTTTTAAPGIALGVAPGVTPETKTSSSVTPPPRGGEANNNQINTNKALTGAADPGLAVGVGSTGQDIRQNARPSRPNPGTEVGLDYSPPKPQSGLGPGNNGAGYRDWAAELTGAGQPSQPIPKLPSKGPAITNEGGRPTSLPGSVPAQSQGGKPSSTSGNVSPQSQGVRPTSLPGNLPSQPQAGNRQPPPLGPRPGSTDQGKPQVSPPNIGGSSHTASNPTLSPQNKPSPLNPVSNGGSNVPTGAGQKHDDRTNSPSASSATNVGQPDFPSLPKNAPTSPNSPTTGPRPGSPSWADVAAGGSRPNSPTPASKSSGYPSTGGTSPPTQQSGNSKRPAGSAIAAGAIAAGGAAAAGAAGKTVYSSNPTYSKGNTITDDDLEKLSEALFIKDRNNAMRYITLNLQKQTTSSSSVDEAPQPLFTISPEALQIPTIQKVLTIYDNYNPDQRTNEYISPAQRQEESLLVDTFLSTDVMASAMRFLADKGHVAKDYYEYKDTLRRLWFNLYSRGEGKIGSTGFEHVFLHEEKIQDSATEIGGLHNWIYFSTEEKKGKVNYLGYMKKLDLGNKASILKVHAKYNGYDKPTMTMFIGTSPELEMALYTVCHFARESKPCPVSLGGTKFNIATYKFRYRGKDLISSAFPDI